MVSTPNRLNPFVTETNPLPPVEGFAGVDRQFLIKVGPPEAALSVSVIEPETQTPQPKGTILVLHGIHARSFWMLGPARALAEAGYRTVLVDLRGHGRSTGDYLTFGVQEAQDLSQVIDALQRHGLVAGKIGVYGISGLAKFDPDRPLPPQPSPAPGCPRSQPTGLGPLARPRGHLVRPHL